jgi:proteic killer suppression protein
MIKTFKCRETERIWNGIFSKKFPAELQAKNNSIIKRKLYLLDAAQSLSDLLYPPGNNLEALRGDRQGQYSIRVNQKYRICFRFLDDNCFHVELVDYH